MLGVKLHHLCCATRTHAHHGRVQTRARGRTCGGRRTCCDSSCSAARLASPTRCSRTVNRDLQATHHASPLETRWIGVPALRSVSHGWKAAGSGARARAGVNGRGRPPARAPHLGETGETLADEANWWTRCRLMLGNRDRDEATVLLCGVVAPKERVRRLAARTPQTTRPFGDVL